MATESLRFEVFDKSRHNREAFDCGVESLNNYLKRTLNQQMQRAITVGYVLTTPDGRIAGYVTLSSGKLPVGAVPEGHHFPRTLPLPATLIGRLGVDRAYAGRGLGKDLLIHALKIAVRNAEHIASAVIEVDALSEAARSFYTKFGFMSLPDDELHMYLPMRDARVLVESHFRTG